jgi:hypothetical protein
MIINVLHRFVIRCLVARIEPKFAIKEYMNRIDYLDLDTSEDVRNGTIKGLEGCLNQERLKYSVMTKRITLRNRIN